MITKFIRDAFRRPVACVVSSAAGRVGWSVYHPNDYKEVVKKDCVGLDANGNPVFEPRLNADLKPVLCRKNVPFSKREAVLTAVEREIADVRKAIQEMEAAVPEERMVSRYIEKEVELIERESGKPISRIMYMPCLVNVSLKDELAIVIERVWKRSSRPVKVKVQEG